MVIFRMKSILFVCSKKKKKNVAFGFVCIFMYQIFRERKRTKFSFAKILKRKNYFCFFKMADFLGATQTMSATKSRGLGITRLFKEAINNNGMSGLQLEEAFEYTARVAFGEAGTAVPSLEEGWTSEQFNNQIDALVGQVVVTSIKWNGDHDAKNQAALLYLKDGEPWLHISKKYNMVPGTDAYDVDKSADVCFTPIINHGDDVGQVVGLHSGIFWCCLREKIQSETILKLRRQMAELARKSQLGDTMSVAAMANGDDNVRLQAEVRTHHATIEQLRKAASVSAAAVSSSSSSMSPQQQRQQVMIGRLQAEIASLRQQLQAAASTSPSHTKPNTQLVDEIQSLRGQLQKLRQQSSVSSFGPESESAPWVSSLDIEKFSFASNRDALLFHTSAESLMLTLRGYYGPHPGETARGDAWRKLVFDALGSWFAAMRPLAQFVPPVNWSSSPAAQVGDKLLALLRLQVLKLPVEKYLSELDAQMAKKLLEVAEDEDDAVASARASAIAKVQQQQERSNSKGRGRGGRGWPSKNGFQSGGRGAKASNSGTH